MKSILSVAEAYTKMSEDAKSLAATDAAQAQQKQEDQPEIPSWVPGNIPGEKKKEFAEAAKKAWESDNTQFDFDGRTYKITEKLHGDQHKLDVNNNGKIDANDLAALRSGEKQANEELVGNQHKLDVNKNGKIDGDDLAALRAGEKPTNEHHLENETETPGQTQYPGSDMKDTNGNGEIDGEDKAEMPGKDDDEEENDEGLEESVRLKKSQDMLKVAHGAMSRDEYKKKWAHLKKPKNKLAGPGGLYKNLVKEGEENPTDKLTIDVPAMIRALEKSREDFKSDEDIHNFVQDLLKKKDSTIDTNALPTNESVNEAMSAIVTRKNADGSYDEVGMNNRRVLGGSHSNIMKQASDFAKGPHRVELFHGNRVGYGAPHKVIHVESAAVAEKLDPKADAGEWISDFVHSTDPKFDGKSKEKRKEMALAAYYQARRDAGLKEEVMTEATATDLSKKAHALSSAANTAKDHKTAANAHYKAAEALRRHTTANAAKTGSKADAAHDAALKHEELGDKHLEKAMTKKESTQINENVAGDARAVDLTTAANQASALAHSAPAEAGALAHHDAATKAHQHAADHYRVYAHHAGDPELRRAAEIHHKFHSDMAQHHTLKGVSLSMGDKPADNVNRYASGHMEEGTSADAKGGPEVMDVSTKKMKDDADKNVKAEEAPYTNKADGTEEVTPADKPKPNPTSMTKLTAEQTIKSVAEAYVAMTNEAASEGAALSAAAEKASNATKKHIDGEDFHSAVDDHLTAASLHAKAAQYHDKHGNKEKADHHLNSELLHHAEADGASDAADDEGDDDAWKLKQHVSDYASQKGNLRRSPKSDHPTPAWHPDHPSNK